MEAERERNTNQLSLAHTPSWNQTPQPGHVPGICPDQESNWQPFVVQDNAQPTEPHRSGQNSGYFCVIWEQRLIGKGNERTFWVIEMFYILTGYTGKCICQSSSNCDLGFVHFTYIKNKRLTNNN